MGGGAKIFGRVVKVGAKNFGHVLKNSDSSQNGGGISGLTYSFDSLKFSVFLWFYGVLGIFKF